MHGLEQIFADVAAAGRNVARHWRTATVNVGLMAAGLVGTCIFVSLSDATIRGDLGFAHAERLRAIDAIVDGVEYTGNSLSAAELSLIASTEVFDGVTVMRRGQYKIGLASDRRGWYAGAHADAAMTSVLGTDPLIGRWFLPSDVVPGAPPVAVIGFDIWHAAFGGDSSAIGSFVAVNDVRHQVIGVMAEGFAFPLHEQLWLPLDVPTSAGPNDRRRFAAFGTLKDGVPERGASVAVASAVRAAGSVATEDRSAHVRPVQLSAIGGGVGVLVVRTMEVVSFLIYIVACVNAMGLLAGRAIGRLKEIRVRKVVGASTARLLWQFTLEGFVVSCTSILVAIPVAASVLAHLEQLVFANIAAAPFWWSFGLSPRAVWIAVTAVPIGSLAVGFLPVVATVGLGAMRGNPRRRSVSRALGLSLVLLQTFIGVLLSTVAMGFLRTLWDRTENSLGFVPDRFLQAQVELPEAAAKEVDVFVRVVEDIERAVLSVPGFDGAAVTDFTPGVGTRGATVRRSDGTTHEVNLAGVSSGFFETAVPPITTRQGWSAGRMLGTRQAVVTEGFLEASEDRHFAFASAPGSPWQVVGVVGKVTMGSGYQPGDEDPTVFVALQPKRLLSVLLRYEDGPFAGAVEEGRKALATATPGMEVFEIVALRQVIEKNAAGMPMVAQVLLAAASVASVFAFAGLVGVLGKHTTQARRETGIRRSLGAGVMDIVRQIGGRFWLATFAGVVGGVACSIYVQAILQDIGLVDAAWVWDAMCGAVVLLVTGVCSAGTVLWLMDDSPYGGVRES